MSTSQLHPPLESSGGEKLSVLGIARISGDNQDVLSLADQEALYHEWIKRNYGGPYTLRMIAGRGSGEYLDRPEVREAEEAVESGEYDLVLAEDLGRIMRRVHALLFCELAEDVGTRLIAINDQVDTAREGWRVNAFFATVRHELYNADTAKRIRRTLRNRFAEGGVFQCEIFGYIKPHPHAKDDEVYKDPAAEMIYDEWFRMLENGATFAEVADWLNALNVPVGPYDRSGRWTGTSVGRVTRNTILKGLRVRNGRKSKRINKTGRRKSIKADSEERLERDCPHLAFIEPARYDRVIRLLRDRNAGYRRKGENGRDTRRNVPGKRSRWPGRSIRCGICRWKFVWGGHGQTDHLMCDGCRAHKCWNGVSVDGPLAVKKLTSAIFAAIENLPGFDETLQETLRQDLDRALSNRQQRLAALDQQLRTVQGQIGNLLEHLRCRPNSAALLGELDRLEAELDCLSDDRQAVASAPSDVPQLPAISEIRRLACEALQGEADDPWEFARRMRRWLPRIDVYPFRLCDGGKVVLRARFVLQLASLVPGAAESPAVQDALSVPLEVDLFDPPQRAAFRERIMQLRSQHWTEKQVAQELGLTVTITQRAAVLHRMMEQLQLTDPYVELHEPPSDDCKLRRHLHPRYKFEPLTGED